LGRCATLVNASRSPVSTRGVARSENSQIPVQLARGRARRRPVLIGTPGLLVAVPLRAASGGRGAVDQTMTPAPTRPMFLERGLDISNLMRAGGVRRAACGGMAALLLVTFVQPSLGQNGRRTVSLSFSVADSESGASVPNAILRISGRPTPLRTSWAGEARADSLDRGVHLLVINALGFSPTELTVELTNDTSLIFVRLARTPAALSPMRIIGHRNDVPLRLQGYYARKRMGIGRFITDSMLANAHNVPLSLILATHVPGLRAIGSQVVSAEADTRGGLSCPVLTYIDGIRLNISIDEFRAEDVAGVEVYSRAAAPVQFRPSGDYCTVIALWTRWCGG